MNYVCTNMEHAVNLGSKLVETPQYQGTLPQAWCANMVHDGLFQTTDVIKHFMLLF